MMHEISIPYTVISSAARNLFRPLFSSSFAKPFTGSTAPHLFTIRCFPFLAVGHAPSYRQRKRSLDFARDDDTGKMRFPHILCMMHGVFILHTIISSVARNGNTGRTFSQRTLYTIQRISIPPHCHFERSEKSFSSPFSTTPSLSRLREAPPTAFPAIRCFPFLAAKHTPSYRQRKRFSGFASDDDTWDIPPPRKKSPSQSWSFFVSERLICQTVRAWCLLLLQYQ